MGAIVLLMLVLLLWTSCSEDQLFHGNARIQTTFRLKSPTALDGNVTIQDAYLKLNSLGVTGALGDQNVPAATYPVAPEEPPYRLTESDSAQVTLTLPSHAYDLLDLHLLLFQSKYQLITLQQPAEPAPPPADNNEGTTGDAGGDTSSGGNTDSGSDDGSQSGGESDTPANNGDSDGQEDNEAGSGGDDDHNEEPSGDDDTDTDNGSDADDEETDTPQPEGDKDDGDNENTDNDDNEEDKDDDEKDDSKGKGDDKDDKKGDGQGDKNDKEDEGKGDKDEGKGDKDDDGDDEEKDNDKDDDGKGDEDKDDDDKDDDEKDDGRAQNEVGGTVDLDDFFQNAKPSLVVFATWNVNGESINIVFAVTDVERITIRATQSGNQSIMLADHGTASVIFDPEKWFQSVSTTDLQNATRQTYQGQSVVFIHHNHNTELFDALYASLIESTTLEFSVPSVE